MNNEKLNIEDLYSKQFEEFTTEPSAGLWTRIRYKLMWQEFFRFSLNSFNIYYLALATAITAGGIILISQLNRPENINAENIAPAPSIEAPSPTGVVSNVNQPETSPGERKGLVSGHQKSSRSEAGEGSESVDQGAKQLSYSGKSPDNKVSGDDNISGSEKESSANPAPNKESVTETTATNATKMNASNIPASAAFGKSCQSGCAPLAVNFLNQSVNAAGYYWTFGDGGCSSEQNPKYVFDVPGDYTINLKVTGNDGKDYTASSEIKVHQTPKAYFEYDAEADITKGEPVNFYNYSKDADYYEWDFGDNNRSKLNEPVHYYEAPGNYTVKLVAWTSSLCYDSVVVKNAFTPANQDIIFPNAFTPNMNGPVGGHYTPNDPDNEVFYPVLSGDILEYNLRIFNRLGYQVFESNDPSIGWDGYYENQLSSQGVFIWKVRGRFANGKTFLKSGDVTLIWTK
jgi:PKD repeat protein